MPAEDERESVVLIQDCKLLATCRVSFTCMLTWSDFIRYWGPYEAEELLPLLEDELEPCEDELPDCCAGAWPDVGTLELEPEVNSPPPQPAIRIPTIKSIPTKPSIS